MCTVISIFGTTAFPFVLAGNRDEFFARPSRGFFRWPPEEGGFIAGKDERSGGTWLGIGEHLVAALTNDRLQGREAPGVASRGELVVRALRSPSLAAFEAQLSTLAADHFGGFHLLVSDKRRMRYFTNVEGRLSARTVPPGVHLLGNWGLNHQQDPRVAWVREAFARLRQERAPWPRLLSQIQALLATHEHQGPCVHYPGYGTRSAAIFLAEGVQHRLYTVAEPPCTGVWQNQSSLLTAGVNLFCK